MMLSVFCSILLLTYTLSSAEEILTKTRPDEREPKKVIVTITDSKKTGYSFFQPRILTILAGDTVSLVNKDSRTHFVTYMKDNYPVRYYTAETDDEEEEENETDGNKFFSSSEIEPGETFTHTFNKPGIYKYFCFTHPIDMQGAIIVNK